MNPPPKTVQSLAKFITYLLGRRPDEFGLVPDERGFVKIKELLKVLHEEPGWSYVRADHLRELRFSESTNVIEIGDERVRARQRDHLPSRIKPDRLPSILYTAVRRRAYPFVHDQGLRAFSPPGIVLSSQNEMTLRIGRRVDAQPVILNVPVAVAQSAGVQFTQYGETLFLADFIPPGALKGPPLPRTAPRPKAAPKADRPQTPGSYFADPAAIEDPAAAAARRSRRKDKDWKQDRRAARRVKERQRRGS